MNLPDRSAPAEKASVRRKDTLRWWLLAVTLLAVVATGALATWQLRRAAFKEALTQQMLTQGHLAPLQTMADLKMQSDDARTLNLNAASGLNAPAGESNPWIHRRVNLTGTWLAQYTVYLDNRFMAGRAGFYVLTPLLQKDSVVWVQRGWVPRNVQDRTQLPDVLTPAGVVLVPGRVIQAVSRAYALGEPKSGNSSSSATVLGTVPSALGTARESRIWQNLPIVSFAAPLQLMPLAVLQTDDASEDASADVQLLQTAPMVLRKLPDGLLRDWPRVDAGVAKHYGYAFQWFALCGLIIVLYVWFQILAPRRTTSRSPAPRSAD